MRRVLFTYNIATAYKHIQFKIEHLEHCCRLSSSFFLSVTNLFCFHTLCTASSIAPFPAVAFPQMLALSLLSVEIWDRWYPARQKCKFYCAAALPLLGPCAPAAAQAERPPHPLRRNQTQQPAPARAPRGLAPPPLAGPPASDAIAARPCLQPRAAPGLSSRRPGQRERATTAESRAGRRRPQSAVRAPGPGRSLRAGHGSAPRGRGPAPAPHPRRGGRARRRPAPFRRPAGRSGP